MSKGFERDAWQGRRVGLFGGTFDPPHVGHLIVARDVREALALDEVRMVVAARSPFKPEGQATEASVRARMVEAAVQAEEGLTVSRIELDRGGTSWTIDTLRQLVEREPETTWHLILGADQFGAFDRWREPREIVRLAELVVFDRGGLEVGEVDPAPDVPHRRLDVTRIDVSSTLIRERVGRGRSVRWLVPDGTLRIMRSEDLYLDADARSAHPAESE